MSFASLENPAKEDADRDDQPPIRVSVNFDRPSPSPETLAFQQLRSKQDPLQRRMGKTRTHYVRADGARLSLYCDRK